MARFKKLSLSEALAAPRPSWAKRAPSKTSEWFLDTRTNEIVSKRQRQRAEALGQYREFAIAPRGAKRQKLAAELIRPVTERKSHKSKGANVRSIGKGQTAETYAEQKRLLARVKKYRYNENRRDEYLESLEELFKITPRDRWQILRAILGSP